MNSFKIREKNIVLNKIKEIKVYIKRNSDTISRLSKQKMSDFEKKQIEKLTAKNIEYEKEIKDCEIKLQEINNGSYDIEIKKEMDHEASNITKKNIKIQDKLNSKKEKDESDKKYIKMSYMNNDNFCSEKMMEREYNKFLRDFNSIPEYMKRNLAEMPGNKGYIWKGISCYGDLPEEKGQPRILFEKIHNSDILKIHEITEDFTYVYEKHGKERKKLISKTPRSDFIKYFRKLFAENII